MKKIAIIFLLFLISFSHFSSAEASQLPRYLGKEKKFRMFIYNPFDVYRYTGNYNYHGFIEFQGSQRQQPDGEIASNTSSGVEKVIEVAIGNSDAWLWKISDSKNRLYLKPVGDNANTNMTVKTDRGRIYNFELLARTPTGPDDENLIFAVKFVYPDDTDRNILQFPKTPVSDQPDMRDLSIYNFNYQYTGEPTIAPMKVFDNGEFTYLQFASKNAELPAIFAVDSDGFESLVNFRMAGDYIIVERVGSQFTLRNGGDIVCVYNGNLFKSGRTNPATSQSGPIKSLPPSSNYNRKMTSSTSRGEISQ
ncbi:MAG: type IV secretion system protein VirB9 [Rickettsiales bacterium]|jgi:type IV secretion system protein VirB9